ncbi:MAG TPA: MMPL family transporter, partial [Solirubrobacteraceae bacterium]|nr:MMPL family transporter [Solirubrobacteraceae bacterium]
MTHPQGQAAREHLLGIETDRSSARPSRRRAVGHWVRGVSVCGTRRGMRARRRRRSGRVRREWPGTATFGLLSHVIQMASFSSQLSLLIGLGVGVDYALFIVTRYREGLQRGKSIEDAIVDAVDTSGRAVLFAGITVCI